MMKTNNVPLFHLGFRCFFLGASIFSVLSIFFWMLVYLFEYSIPLKFISTYQWHAHEMIYGYTMAVIVGFLLTAVKNWTKIQTITGFPLFLLFFFWLGARILLFFGTSYILAAFILDMIFSIYSICAISHPIIQAKQWKQLAILSKVIVLTLLNSLFYLSVLEMIKPKIYISIYGGLYLIVALILTVGRRIIPFFIERACNVQPFNSKFLDLSSLIFFLFFFISEMFWLNDKISAVLSLILFFIYSIRLIGWYNKKIWTQGLLWSLYVSLCFINIGFLLIAGVYYFQISKLLAIHAFTYGGIGAITLGMMSRVSIGHTGRNVYQPPKYINYAFGLIFLGATMRVFFPLFFSDFYIIWIAISSILWIVSFIIFLFIFTPFLIKHRIDGLVG